MSLTEDELPGRWVVTETARFNLRGEPSAPYLPYYRDNPLYHRPGSQGLRHDGQAVTTADRFEILADPLGRTIRALNPPESENGPRFATLTQFLPFEVRAFDPEDARPDSPHFGTPMVYLQDGLQRLREVQEITRLDDEGTAGAGLNTWSTRYRYDLNGKLIAIQDAQANLQWFRRDGLARLLFKHDPDRGTRTYRYSASSSLIAVVDAKGQETTLTYDGLNRLLTEDYHDEDLPFSANRRYDPTQPMGGDNQPDVAYFYDAGPPSVDLGNGDLAIPVNTRGALARVTDLAGETISSFDARGRLAWEVRNLPDPRNGQPTAYTTRIRYDALDRIVEVIYPDEDRVRYEYNARNLLERIHGGARAHPDGSPFLVAATDYLPRATSRLAITGMARSQPFATIPGSGSGGAPSPGTPPIRGSITAITSMPRRISPASRTCALATEMPRPNNSSTPRTSATTISTGLPPSTTQPFHQVSVPPRPAVLIFATIASEIGSTKTQTSTNAQTAAPWSTSAT
jgi:YD repeat-containing protein